MPGYRFDDDQRGKLSTVQHEIPYRDLLIGQMVGDPLVYAFVPAADQHDVRVGDELEDTIDENVDVARRGVAALGDRAMDEGGVDVLCMRSPVWRAGRY